jgi:hypothetical protein
MRKTAIFEFALPALAELAAPRDRRLADDAPCEVVALPAAPAAECSALAARRLGQLGSTMAIATEAEVATHGAISMMETVPG